MTDRAEKVVVRRRRCPACLSFVSPSDKPMIAKWYCHKCRKYRSEIDVERSYVND